MFGSLASTSTSTSTHLSRDPFAFLDTGKQYVTMIREVLPLRPSPSKKLSTTATLSSSSSSTASSSSWDHLTSPSDTSSSDEEEELETPSASPQNSTISLPSLVASRKGKSKVDSTASILQFSFSMNEISEDDDVRGPNFDWVSPSSPNTPYYPTPSSSSPSLDESLSLPTLSPPPKPKLSTTTLPHPHSPSVSPPLVSRSRKPTRAEEERYRGRTRSPRLLWRSELDEPAMKLLDVYHRESVGGNLPILKSGMGRREVREWSRRVEEAGI